jgi:hypothetical protein
MLSTFTRPHLRILISSGPNCLLSFKLMISSDDFAVILSSPINIACEDFNKELFFFSFKL